MHPESLVDLVGFVAYLIHAGGRPNQLLALLALFAVPASVVLSVRAYTRGRSVAAGAAAGLAAIGALAVGIGFAGQALAMRGGEAAVGFANPVDRAALWLACASEARTCVVVGLAVAAIPLAGAALACARALAARASAFTTAGGVLLAVGIAVLAGGAASWQFAFAEREWDAGRAQHEQELVLPADTEPPAFAPPIVAAPPLPRSMLLAGGLACLGAALAAAGTARERPRPS